MAVDPQAMAPSDAPTPARFCPACGAVRADAESACGACDARLESPVERADAAYTRRYGAIRGALTLYFSLLGVSVVMLIVALCGPDKPSPRMEVGLDVSGSILFSVVVAAFGVWKRAELAPVLRTWGRGVWYGVALGVALATFGLATGIVSVLRSAMQTPIIDYFEPYRQAHIGVWLPLLTVAVQPAVFEELAFRGMIGRGMGLALNARDGVIVTALLFAVLHLSVLSMVHLAAIGLALGVLRQLSGSLYPGMLLHLMHNALVLGAEWFVHPSSVPPNTP